MAEKSDAKPTVPETYSVPKVWTVPESMGGKFGGMNKPTAGARFERNLPKGEHPLQLYSLGTPNGQKVTILLEELGVDYDAWKISFDKLDQFGSDFVKVNPNSKIPAMMDYSQSPPLRVFETGSILLYLAEKEGKFIPSDAYKRTECLNWLFWQIGTAPYIGGGFGHFYKYAPVHFEYAINRFTMETKRIVDVLDKHLEGKEYICGDEYTIADIATYPWIGCLDWGYNAKDFLQLDDYQNVKKWIERIEARPAVKRGRRVNGFGKDAIAERHSPKDFE